MSHPPGSLVIADGRLFVGQVFSDFVLVIDLATHAIVKRIVLPGGGDGQLAVSQNEKEIYFALNQDSPDWKRLENEGFCLLSFGSQEHLNILKSC